MLAVEENTRFNPWQLTQGGHRALLSLSVEEYSQKLQEAHLVSSSRQVSMITYGVLIWGVYG